MGALLKKVGYVSRCEEQITDLAGNTIFVKNTFPYNPESKTAPSTAKSWATTYGSSYEPTAEIVENNPFSVRIVELDERGQGGRAYRVVDDAGRMFDLREDQVTHVIGNYGIQKGGAIPVKFVWGIHGTSPKLVAVGSSLYKEMKEYAAIVDSISQKKKFEVGDIKPGDVVQCSYAKRIFTSLYVGTFKFKGEKEKRHCFFELDLEFIKRQNPEIADSLSKMSLQQLYEQAVEISKSTFSKVDKVNNSIDAYKSMNHVVSVVGNVEVDVKHLRERIVRKAGCGVISPKSFDYGKTPRWPIGCDYQAASDLWNKLLKEFQEEKYEFTKQETEWID